MYRLLLLWSKIQKNGIKVLAVTAIAVFAALIILFSVETNRLQGDIEIYESEIAYLNEKHAEYQNALETHEELLKTVAKLESEADALENKNDSLGDEITTLAEEKNELERQNGEMLKKFDGLSKPK